MENFAKRIEVKARVKEGSFGVGRLLGLLLLPMLLSNVLAEEIRGRVVGCTDGDTLTVLDGNNTQHTIRLFAIDTPETSCHEKNPSARDAVCVEHSQPFGKAAKKSLSNLVFGKDVVVKLQPGSTYGREIGTVFMGDLDVNLEQVRQGMAWVYRQYAKKMHSDTYSEYNLAEQHAKEVGLGLWVDSDPVPPWEWRYSSR